ncbi:MAG: hypothetical protein ACREDA_11760, partial [Methylocella sp.]
MTGRFGRSRAAAFPVAKARAVAITSFLRPRSIGAKIFGAFVAMGLITATLGGYGLYVLSSAGKLVVDTYDGPLMAVNFARSASLTFASMNEEILRRKLAPAAERPAIDRAIEKLVPNFFDDIGVAEQRALAADERNVVAEIKRLVARWNELRKAPNAGENDDLDALAKRIVARFDVLIELIADHSFIERRKAIWAIGYFNYTSVAAILLALLLSAAITLL